MLGIPNYILLKGAGAAQLAQDALSHGANTYALGVPEEFALRMAGKYQQDTGHSKPEWGNWHGNPPYGDDRNDQVWIKRGRRNAIQNDNAWFR
jgi:hypothetical protein